MLINILIGKDKKYPDKKTMLITGRMTAYNFLLAFDKENPDTLFTTKNISVQHNK